MSLRRHGERGKRMTYAEYLREFCHITLSFIHDIDGQCPEDANRLSSVRHYLQAGLTQQFNESNQVPSDYDGPVHSFFYMAGVLGIPCPLGASWVFPGLQGVTEGDIEGESLYG